MSAAAARYLNISFIWHTSIGICYQRHLSWYVWLLIILVLKQQGWRLFTVSKQMSIQNLRVTKFIIKSGRAIVCAIALKQRIRLSWSAMMNPQTHVCVAVMSLGRTYLVQIGNHMFDVQVRAFSYQQIVFFPNKMQFLICRLLLLLTCKVLTCIQIF